jgi:hypothetical protein
MGLIVAGAASTGGLAAIALKVSRKESNTSEVTSKSNERSSPDVNQHN